MKKRVFVLLAIAAYSISILAHEAYINNIAYNFDKSSLTATVTYRTAAIFPYPTMHTYKGSVSIPATIEYKGAIYNVTYIDEYAFEGNEGLTEIIIPSSIQSIGEYAFKDCKNLVSIVWNAKKCNNFTEQSKPFGASVTSFVFGEDVEYLPNHICDGLTSLESIIIPSNVIRIGDYSFANCTNLTTIAISSNVITTIGNSAFRGCNNLASISMPNSIVTIGNSAFFDCKQLKSITLPTDIKIIGEYTFANCNNLSSLVLPKHLKKIGMSAFSHCRQLQCVIVPAEVSTIGDCAYKDCANLSTIILPHSISYIGQNAFEGCNQLTVCSATSYTVNFDNVGLANENKIIRVAKDQLVYYYPFSIYAKDYVETHINEWQKKGEFERTTDWKERVNEQTRKSLIKQLLADAEQKYVAFHAKEKKVIMTLGKYDADNEVFAMTDSDGETIYLAVPIEEAKDFKDNWSKITVNRQMQILNDQIKLAGVTFSMPNGKEYTYRNTDAVNYNLAEVEYNFDPIELDIPKHSVSPQGERNITTTKVQIGMSKVDIDIPSSETSNPNSFVIIFANEDYKNVASVPFAKNDGTIFQKYCQRTLGIPASNIHYVENASFNDIRIQLAWLKDVCDAYEGHASVIAYYAGHGIPDETTKSAYILPVDGDGRYVQSAYKVDDFYQKLGGLNAQKVTVFMDACFSGSKREDGMLASARGVALKAKSGVPQGNMVVFSAAQGDETAYPNSDEHHGIFTYFLLKKLQETEGEVTLQELGDYISQNVRQQSIVKNGKKQTPCVTPSAEVGTDWQNWKLK